MTIVQLEYLLAVVNQGSFSAAARQCSVTQPSLSIQIQNLEDELEVILLNRNTKPVTLTEAGLLVLEQAKKAIAEFYKMKEKVNELKGTLSGKLRIGAIPTISPYLMPYFIPEFTTQCPEVELELCDMFPADIVNAINRDLIDVAILSGEDLPSHFKEKKLFVDPLYVYVSQENELYNRSVIYEHDFDYSRLLFLSEGLCHSNKRKELCEIKKKIKGQHSFISTSLETLINVADTTGSVTIIPGMAVGYIPEEKRKQVKVFGQPNSYRTITMVVGCTCVKKALINAVRKSIITVAEQYLRSDFLRL